MSEKLKACPFCGGEGQMQHYDFSVWVECENCECMSASDDDGNCDVAIKAWNTRAERSLDVGKIEETIKLGCERYCKEPHMCRTFDGKLKKCREKIRIAKAIASGDVWEEGK